MGIYRTEHLKYTTNYGDGLGKDSYVINNNGGLRTDPQMWGSRGKSGWNSNVMTGTGPLGSRK